MNSASPSVLPPTAGVVSDRDARQRPLLAAVGAALVLAACGGAQQAGFGGFPPAPVAVAAVQPVSVPVRLEFTGQAAGSREAEVRARVQGILERRAYQEGGRVSAGQTLFVLDSRPYVAQLKQAEAALARARVQHAQARRDLERQKELAASNVVSPRALDDATAAEEAAAAGVLAAEAQVIEARLNVSYTTVTAPVAGYASRSLKSEGTLVTPGQDSLLTTVSQLDPMHVNFSLSESERTRLERLLARAPAAAAPEATLRLSDGSEFPRRGRLTFIDPRINPATGAYEARAEVANPDGALRPGQFVRVVLDAGQRPDTVVVPQRAVMDGPQGKFVYVAGKSGDGRDVALPRPVVVGDWVELGGARLWIVESGLQAGDQVVVEGMAKIFPIPGGSPIALGPPPGEPSDAVKGEVRK